MPRFPELSPAVVEMKGSVYSHLAHKLKQVKGPLFPMHVGDTWMDPPMGCRMQDLKLTDHPDLNKYSPPRGRPELIDAIVDVKGRQMGCSLAAEQVLVVSGATSGLGSVVGAMVSSGDEVIILAPHWPLIAGIVQSFRGTPVAVPVIDEGLDVEGFVDQLNRFRSSRTVAIYLNSPNNPSGELLPIQWLQALAVWAEKHQIWILSDEVYDLYVYQGRHSYMHNLAPDRTVSAFSFSKAFGMAGNRCGFLIGPPALLRQAEKMSTHGIYSTPTASQIVAERVLTHAGGAAWVKNAQSKYAEIGSWSASALGVPPPKGGTFLFIDISASLDERGLAPFLERCVERGLLVGPGPSFGPYPNHIRLCFTCIDPARTRQGVHILADLLRR